MQAAQGNAAAGSGLGDALSSDSSFLSTLDPIIARPFQEGFVESTHLVYIVGGIIMAVAFVLVLIMKELPLRTESALEERLREQAQADADRASTRRPSERPRRRDSRAGGTPLRAAGRPDGRGTTGGETGAVPRRRVSPR